MIVYGDFCKGVLPGFFKVCVKVFFFDVHAHQAFTHNLHKHSFVQACIYTNTLSLEVSARLVLHVSWRFVHHLL